MEDFKEPKSVSKKIDTLRSQIETANHKYYVLQAPDISDQEYDDMMSDLIDLEKRFPELITPESPTQRVGGSPSTGFSTVLHVDEMLSLSNVFNMEQLYEWRKRTEKNIGEPIKEFILEEKIDGLAISLTYSSGLLLRGATRGNGRQGEDITENLKTIRSIPLKLMGSDFPDDFEVRGEVFFPLSAFEKYNEERVGNGEVPYSNTRNAASGALRQLDPAEAAKRPLDAFFYSIGNVRNTKIISQYQLLKKLKDWGFKTNLNSHLINNFDDVPDIINKKIETRLALNYSIDGMVIKVNKIDFQEYLGNTSKDPRWATAIKFPATKVETKLIDIKISLGRTGVATPYAVLEPVDLDGVTIKSATLHNLDYIRSKDIRAGDDVVIQRAGDVIPQVVKPSNINNRISSSTEFQMPEECPVCFSQLIKYENDPFTRCINSKCSQQMKRLIEHYASKQSVDIEGLGEGIINQLFEKGLIRSITDLYKITSDDLIDLEGFGQKSVKNLLDSIEKSKTKPISRIVHGLGIPHVGSELSEVLTDYFGSIDSIFLATYEDLQQIDGVGPKISESIHKWFETTENKKLLEELKLLGISYKDLTIKTTSNILSGKNICVTGQLSKFSREEIKNKIKMLGGKFHSSVTSNTNILIAGENSGTKLQKAENLGIDIINEEAFDSLIRSNG